jgi:hypothetical protein
MAGVNEDSQNTNFATLDFDNGDVELTHNETEALRHIGNITSHRYLATGVMPALSGSSFSTEAYIDEQSVVSHSGAGEDISAR